MPLTRPSVADALTDTTIPGVCLGCGQPAIWMRTGKQALVHLESKPLKVFVVGSDGVCYEVTGFVRHVCPPDPESEE